MLLEELVIPGALLSTACTRKGTESIYVSVTHIHLDVALSELKACRL